MISTVNAGFTIIGAVPVTGRGDEFIVTGVNASEAVTWRASLGTAYNPDKWLYMGGHYFHGESSRVEALQEMLTRAGFIPEA